MTANLAEDKKQSLLTFCKEFNENLTEAGIRTRIDDRENYSPGWKFNHWELKVRIRVGMEIGLGLEL
jgi:bifunctional glutamyl/prolyl-tRNA synthetase